MKGRLPEGVDFAAYPGRSSTPLPTAESKSAERINQLKIWNEAATNDDKRRLNAKSKPGGARRTDSFKDAKDRQSASFNGAPQVDKQPGRDHQPIRRGGVRVGGDRDMFADRSESESEEEEDEPNVLDQRIVDHVAVKPVVQQQHSPIKQDLTPVVPVAQHQQAHRYQQTHQSQSPQLEPLPMQPQAMDDRAERKESKACCVIM